MGRHLKRGAAIAAVLVLLVLWGVAGAEPIAVGAIVYDQPFEWQDAFDERSDGTYGQYEVELLADTEYEIFTSSVSGGDTTDPYLYLLDAAETIVAEDDDSAGNLHPRITFTPTTTATYLIRLRAYARGRQGFCSLAVASTGEPGVALEPFVAGTTYVDQLYGWLSRYDNRADGSYFEHEIELQLGSTYVIEIVEALGDGDTVLYLLDPGGAQVASDDDGGSGYLSRLEYTAATTGAHRVRLRSYGRGDVGACRVVVSGPPPPEPNPTPEPLPDPDADPLPDPDPNPDPFPDPGPHPGPGGDPPGPTPGPGGDPPEPPPEPDPTPDPDPDPAPHPHPEDDPHAHPNVLEPGDVLTGQGFGWDAAFAQRADGHYFEYAFPMTEGVTYTIETIGAFGGEEDTYLYLLDDTWTILASDDDGGLHRHSKITHTATTTATNYVWLRSYSKGATGSCTLIVIADVQSETPDETILVVPGDVLNDQIFEWRVAYAERSAGDYRQYLIQMTEGEFYTFETSDAEGGDEDTYFYLLDADGNIVFSDDDGGARFMSRVSFVAPTTGPYYLRLRAFSRGALGVCTLTVGGGNVSTGAPLLPDLLSWVTDDYLRDARIQVTGGEKHLRLSAAYANVGAGPLRLYGIVNPSTGDTDAYQVVFNDDGTSTTYLVGQFVFEGHENHNHWHFDQFAIYQLRDAETGEVLRSSNKVSFCLLDSVRYTDSAIPGTSPSGVYDCEDQGISVGWADVYGAHLFGQSIEISGIPDGTYHLVSTVDPSGRLHELTRSNNVAQVTILISGNSVTVLP